MAWLPKIGVIGRARRFARMTASERSALAKRLRYIKGRKHATVTLRAIGHFAYMRLCRVYKRRLGRELKPAERAAIREMHKAEIDASKVGEPWVKKPRVSWPSRD